MLMEINPKNRKTQNSGAFWMEIYVGNIPKGTRPGELRKIIKNAIKEKVFPRLFEKIIDSGQIDKGMGVKIHKAKNTNGEYRYGHVVVHSSGLGKLAMDSLLNAELRGSCLSAREYVARQRDNDRRMTNNPKPPGDITCRRVKDRRKKSH
jgi:hypothetical protein